MIKRLPPAPKGLYINIIILSITIFIIGIALYAAFLNHHDEVGDCGEWDKQGIDVSHYQGRIDWEKVAENSSIKFAYIKATEGSSHQDTLYKHNTVKARLAGIAVGSYHYFHPNVEVAKQYANFMSLVEPLTQDLIPVIDIEEKGRKPSKQICDSLEKFSAMIEAEWGERPIIYTHQRFYNYLLQRSFDDHHLWIARYGAFGFKFEPSLEDSRSYIMWQYSCQGVVEGINGNVDLNTLADECDINIITLKKQLVRQ